MLFLPTRLFWHKILDILLTIDSKKANFHPILCPSRSELPEVLILECMYPLATMCAQSAQIRNPYFHMKKWYSWKTPLISICWHKNQCHIKKWTKISNLAAKGLNDMHCYLCLFFFRFCCSLSLPNSRFLLIFWYGTNFCVNISISAGFFMKIIFSYENMGF